MVCTTVLCYNEMETYTSLSTIFMASETPREQPKKSTQEQLQDLKQQVQFSMEQKQESVDYKVQKGDTLWAVAKRNGIGLSAIVEANPGVDPKKLQVGQIIKVPVLRPVMETNSVEAPTPEPAASNVEGKEAEALYTVKKGDSLWKISKDKKINFYALLAANPDIENPGLIQVGQKIRLSAESQTQTPSAVALNQVQSDKQEAAPKAVEKAEILPNIFVARVIYAEASAMVTKEERELVASVMKNRIGNKDFGAGSTMESVVTAKNAFEAINHAANANWSASAHPETLTGTAKEAWEHAVQLSKGDFASADSSLVYYHDKSISMPANWDNKYYKAVIAKETPHFKFYKAVPKSKK